MLSVVSGVALAVLFVSLVGLTWWSLGALVAASIIVGQVLRLGPNLVEVPISAMLVLGVGYSAGAQSVGAGRVLETLIGAVVGVLVNVLFPPAVQTRHAGQAVERYAEEIAGLLDSAATGLSAGAVTEEQTTQWLEDARRLNRHAPRWTARWPMPRRAAGSTCAHWAPAFRAEPARGRGRPRAQLCLDAHPVPCHRRRHPPAVGRPGEPGLRRRRTGSSAFLMRQMSNVILAFGRLLRRELERSGRPEKEAGRNRSSWLGRSRSWTRRGARSHELLLADLEPARTLGAQLDAAHDPADRLLIELGAAVRTRQRPRLDPSTARRQAMQAAERLRATTRRRVHGTATDPSTGAPDR